MSTYWLVEARERALKSLIEGIARERARMERREIEEIKAKYYELIMAVGNKFPGETRHETALRYIKEAERIESEECAKRGDANGTS